MFKRISQFLLWLWGFKIIGDLPKEIKKYIIIAMPHTSNWDFLLGLLVRSAINAKVNFIGKSSLFKFPHGFIFRWLGGHPVDRSKRTNFVDSIIEIYQKEERFAMVIAPEGTRKKSETIKNRILLHRTWSQYSNCYDKIRLEKKRSRIQPTILPIWQQRRGLQSDI